MILKKIKLFLEKNKYKYQFGILMINIKCDYINHIQNSINYDDIYKVKGNDRFGIQNKLHLTLLYGFIDNINVNFLKKLIIDSGIKEIKRLDPIKVEVFSNNPKYDVLVVKVKTNDKLNWIYKELKKLPNKSIFNEYNPHVTIAYLKKGTYNKYNFNIENIKILTDNIEYISKKGDIYNDF